MTRGSGIQALAKFGESADFGPGSQSQEESVGEMLVGGVIVL